MLMGAVVERNLAGMHEHSYHQHIYPFQVRRRVRETEYFRRGDWRTNWLDRSQQATWLICYRATDIPGKMMVHCHNAKHADDGTLAKEYVRDLRGEDSIAGGECVCNAFGSITGPGIIDDMEQAKVVGRRAFGAVQNLHVTGTAKVLVYVKMPFLM
mmetsp:Transcript_16468/g.47338  ORF Transcript_16468/g.47338 Transcript_16468/m.47338 type:complete len:156 (+) Transcript_16468:138-605(+)